MNFFRIRCRFFVIICFLIALSFSDPEQQDAGDGCQYPKGEAEDEMEESEKPCEHEERQKEQRPHKRDVEQSEGAEKQREKECGAHGFGV